MTEEKINVHAKISRATYRKFKAHMLLNGDKLGEAISKALNFYIKNSKIKVGDYNEE
jgi:hypothetical protein